MKIEIISGSARKNSITKRVALNLFNQLKEDTNHEIGIIDMKDGICQLYNLCLSL
jgi:NAD(P)H-dependent FMN reductase